MTCIDQSELSILTLRARLERSRSAVLTASSARAQASESGEQAGVSSDQAAIRELRPIKGEYIDQSEANILTNQRQVY